MYSPGFFPKGYLCKPNNHGYDMVRALGERHGFDPAATPWNEMTEVAQNAFLFGDAEPMQVLFRSRNKTMSREILFPGFYGFIRDWDVGGTYTDTRPCPTCAGAKLRSEYLAVTLGGQNIHQLSNMPLASLTELVATMPEPQEGTAPTQLVRASLDTIGRRLQVPPSCRTGLSASRPAGVDSLCRRSTANQDRRLAGQWVDFIDRFA